jgi:hypothetical protein
MKKPRVVLTKPSKADMRNAREALRYMVPEHIAEEFRQPRERAAIAAVFRWLALNGVCAWSLKRHGHYATVAMSARVRRKIGTSDAIVLSDEAYEKARRLLCPDA